MKQIMVGILIGLSMSASPVAAAATYTEADVAAHNTAADCWTIVSGKVYNITPYVPFHPGGVAAIVSICGIDGTAAFSGLHSGSASANNALANYYIGDLALPDTTAPSIPTNLAATPVSTSQINLAWTASADNTAVAGYKIYRGGIQIGTSTIPAFNNTGLTASTTYSYSVAAYDAAGNTSALTAPVSATTLGASNNGNSQKWQKWYYKRKAKITYEYNKEISRLTQKRNKELSQTSDSEKIKKITEKYDKAVKKAMEKYNKLISRLDRELLNKTKRFNLISLNHHRNHRKV